MILLLLLSSVIYFIILASCTNENVTVPAFLAKLPLTPPSGDFANEFHM